MKLRRPNLINHFESKIQEITIFPTKLRESLDKNGRLTYEDLFERKKKIENMDVFDFHENKIKKLNEYENLYSDKWIHTT